MLSPSIWRELLRSELIDRGVGRDEAGLIARRVVERLVNLYLRGAVETSAPTTRTLDEAA